MDSLQSFRNLFAYDHWANHAALASLSGIDGAAEKPLKMFAHVLGASRVWQSRFDDPNPPNVQPWPALALDQADLAVDEIYQRWLTLLDRFTEEKLSDNLVYRTTQGAQFETPVRDVFTHLLMHSAYHRGQVAAAVREAGGKPAATDYVFFLRQRSAQ